jgi:hypothetical protein
LKKSSFKFLLAACNLLLALAPFSVLAQTDLHYYLPEPWVFDEKIPTPASVIGHEVGEWYVTHDKLVQYFYSLDQTSEKVKVEKIGKTYEHRPLIQAIITSEKNHSRLKEIRLEHLKLIDPKQSSSCNTAEMPVVVRLGYSVHGNEASGANASMVVAYYLAASTTADVTEILDKCIIILDPSLNPDGMQRFSTWVNQNKSNNLNSDPNSREFHEPWPGGRTNHYWFDLNRDWLFAQHPESTARLEVYRSWMPNVQTDHHEMESTSTFFFQPGIPSSKNPLIPNENVVLTEKIANYHATAMDEQRRLYFSKESFDDFYFGKGSTYPDAQGGIGIVFEQASSRGHLQETTNGPLSFPFAIKNHVTTSLTTLRASVDLRKELLDYQRNFFKNAGLPHFKDKQEAIILGTEDDESRLISLGQVLLKHDIIFYSVKENIQKDGINFQAGKSYIIPLHQQQSMLIKTLFERQTKFTDSLFYDISAWNADLAFNLKTAKVAASEWQGAYGPKVEKLELPSGGISGGRGYAYIMDWNQYYAPAVAYNLLKKDVMLKVVRTPAVVDSVKLNRGSIVIPVAGQKMTEEALYDLLEAAALEYKVNIQSIPSGLASQGVDLGSNSLLNLKKPGIAMLVGESVSSYEVGEVWHLLDFRFDMPVTMIDIKEMDRIRPDRYNVFVLPSGSYSALNAPSQEKLKKWVNDGGTLICWHDAVKFVADLQIADVKIKPTATTDSTTYISYENQDRQKAAQLVSGSIFEMTLDPTHPLAFGYSSELLPVFKSGTMILEPARKASANPFHYSKSPLMSGYASDENVNRFSESPAVSVSVYGQGRIICFVDNPNFRAYWYGTNKLFMNAVFWGFGIDVN